MFTSYLTSVEYEAWVRGLDYTNYVHLHTQFGIEQPAASEELYNLLTAAFCIEILE